MKYGKYLFFGLILAMLLSMAGFASENIDWLETGELLTAPLTTEGYLVNDLRLPQQDDQGGAVTWTSDREDILSADGTLRRPEQGAAVTLTASSATEGYGDIPFAFYVPARDAGFTVEDQNQQLYAATPEEGVALDAAALTESVLRKVPAADASLLADNLWLPKKGQYGSDITWTSTDASVIDTAGAVTRKAVDQSVTLNATIQQGGAQQTKQFPFQVAGKLTDLNGIPAPLDLYYQDDFEDGVLDPHIDLNANAGAMSETGGEILSESANTKNNIADFYLEADKSAVSKEFVTEFLVTRYSGKGTVYIRLYGPGTSVFHEFRWTDSALTGYDGKSLKTFGTNAELLCTQALKLTVQVDWENQTSKVWANNQLISEALAPRTTVNGVVRACVYTGSVITIGIDDFKYYKAMPKMTAQEIVNQDSEALDPSTFSRIPNTNDNPRFLVDNLSLPASGANGSEIAWTSDPPLISETGKVKRGDKDETVVLTATLRIADAQAQRQFTYWIPGADTPVEEGLPYLPVCSYYDDFEDGVMDSRIATTAGSGSFAEEGGELVLASTGTTAHIADISFGRRGDNISGKQVNEFLLVRKAGTGTVYARIRDKSNNAFFDLRWNTGNVLLYNSDGVAEIGTTAEFKAEQLVKVTVALDTEAGTFDLWLNNKLAVKDQAARVAAPGVSGARIYVESATTVGIDEFKYYQDIPDEERLEKDIAGITYENIFKPAEVMDGVIAYDVDMMPTGEYGSEIIWESSLPEIISVSGKVTRPGDEYDTDPEVTLTATIRAGGKQEVKTFTVKVLRASIDLTANYEMHQMIYENDFSSSELDGHFALSPDVGTIQVVDGALQLTHDTVSGNVIADIYPDDEKKAISGLLGVEYTAKREPEGQVQMRLRASGSNDYVALTWGANGNMSVMYTDVIGGAVQSKPVSGSYKSEVKIKLILDTEKESFNLYLNDQEVLTKKFARIAGSKTLTYLRLYLEGSSQMTALFDDVKIYQAKPPVYERAQRDAESITQQSLLTQPLNAVGVLTADLKLPTAGYYDSEISWASSDPAIIAEDGKVTPPLDVEELPEVTLTATISNGGFTAKKQFTFKVTRRFSQEDKLLEGELMDVSYGMLSQDPPEAVVRSLNLSSEGMYGATLSWRSSNTDVITNSGRVIRPRYNEAAKTVTVTLTASYNGKKASRDFTFTVLPDQEWQDPQYMTDTDFFGVWQDGAWKTSGKLDYNRAELKNIETAVKAGDYPAAKLALLEHMRQRTVQSPIKLASRNTGWSNMIIDDFYHLQTNAYYQGETAVSAKEYEKTFVKVQPAKIAKGGSTTYNLVARYNEASQVNIASLEYPDPSMRPQIEVVVNGQARIYDAVADATIRAGNYTKVNYGGDPEMTVKMFGDFLSDETYRSLIRFDFPDLLDTDTVTGARLILHMKSSPAYADSKSIVALFEPSNTWNQNTVTWGGLTTYVHNFNGVPGGNHWDNVPGADAEYLWQMPRFLSWETLGTEYAYTKDEKYAYNMIRIMMDFINDKGGPIYYGGNGWNGQTIRGGYPRTLDTAERLRQWDATLNVLMKSEYMTPDMCTAIMKNIWDMNDSLQKSKVTTGNWIQNESMGVIQGALSVPEFAAAESWIEFGRKKNEELMFINHLSDGSYIEDTGGYSQSAFSTYMEFKRLMQNNGRSVSKEYDEMLLKAGYYNSLLYGPNGSSLQYGDEGYGKSTGQKFPDLATWYGDKELEYITSFGSKGEKPAWTSMHFFDSQTTTMRSDWKKEALFLFTTARGGGQHGHADDNALTVIAYDRTLLNDAGIFTYTSSDPYRRWALSTRAHNTVEINNTTQGAGSYNPGKNHDWATTAQYDFLNQSTKAYSGFDHQRNVVFVKPNFWIVSDLMIPSNMSKANDYKQLWHMLPTANLKSNNTTKQITSNYASGANIIVASADQDAKVVEEMGWYDYSYQQLAEAKYGYFAKDGVVGKATFDTVLLPYKNVGKASADVERIDLGVPTYTATAMKIKTVVDGETNNTYYIRNYETPDGMRTFGKYKTDAKMALVREDAAGAVKEVILYGGSQIQQSDGKALTQIGSLKDFSYEQTGTAVTAYTTIENPKVTGVKFRPDSEVGSVAVNGKYVKFHKDADGYIVLTDEETDVKLPDDPVKGGGITGGGGPGIPVVTPTPGVTPTPTPTPTPSPGLTDIGGHWAEEDIKEMYDKGIVQGDQEQRFHPDNTITRAELVAMVTRAIGLSEAEYAGRFADVSADDWYAGVIQAALDAGLIAEDTAFRPGDKVTREEMAKIIAGAAGRIKELADPPEDYRLDYGDAAAVSGWALEFVEFVSYHGFMSGKENNTFAPGASATRAEAATVLNRILK